MFYRTPRISETVTIRSSAFI